MSNSDVTGDGRVGSPKISDMRRAPVTAAFHMGQPLGFHKLLRQRGDLDPRLIDIAIHPVAGRLVGG